MRLDRLAEALGARLDGRSDAQITRVAALDAATADSLAALFEPRFRAQARQTRAGALIVSPTLQHDTPAGCARLICDDARAAWGRALRLLHPEPSIAPPPVGQHPQALVHATADVDPGARIGPFVVIGARARIEAGAALHPFVCVGPGVKIGARATLMPRATVLDRCEIGPDAWIGPGAVIGSLGFGLDREGRVPHIGIVRIGAGALLGAQTCVDRATVGVTEIGAGARIDNMVQIGHNAFVGPGAVLCGQVGLAGGARVEAGAVIGGQAGVAGHAVVGAGVRVAAQSGVTRSLNGPGDFSGHPAEPNRPRLRRIARLRRLAER